MGRPSEPIIEVARVVEEALVMIDDGGLKALSMRGLGRRLGVNPASLYHHFHNKDDVLEAVREYIIRKARVPPRMANKAWDEQLVALGKAFRSGMTNHPNAIYLVTATNPMRTRTLGHPLYEGVLKSMLDAGFSEEQACYLLTGVETLTTGNVMEEMNFGKTLSYGVVDADRFPNLYRVSRAKSLNIPGSFTTLLKDFITGAGNRMLAENKAAAKRPKAVAR